MFDKALDEMLVGLGETVLRLASISHTPDARRALAASVDSYSVCARSSRDPRVRTMAVRLEATLLPPSHLRLVSSR